MFNTRLVSYFPQIRFRERHHFSWCFSKYAFAFLGLNLLPQPFVFTPQSPQLCVRRAFPFPTNAPSPLGVILPHPSGLIPNCSATAEHFSPVSVTSRQASSLYSRVYLVCFFMVSTPYREFYLSLIQLSDFPLKIIFYFLWNFKKYYKKRKKPHSIQPTA